MTRTVTIFDTLLFAQAMKESGMNEKTANALAEELKKFREESAVATKEEVLTQKSFVEGDINSLRREMQNEFKLVHEEFKLVRSEIKNVALTTIISMGSIMAVIAGIIIAVIKL